MDAWGRKAFFQLSELATNLHSPCALVLVQLMWYILAALFAVRVLHIGYLHRERNWRLDQMPRCCTSPFDLSSRSFLLTICINHSDCILGCLWWCHVLRFCYWVRDTGDWRVIEIGCFDCSSPSFIYNGFVWVELSLFYSSCTWWMQVECYFS